MKYKVGDKVRVREDLEVGKEYGNDIFIKDMSLLKGEIVTISDIKYDFYKLKEDSDKWNWTDEMFSRKIPKDFGSEESDSQSIVPEEESSSNIIFTIKPIKTKLLLL